MSENSKSYGVRGFDENRLGREQEDRETGTLVADSKEADVWNFSGDLVLAGQS